MNYKMSPKPPVPVPGPLLTRCRGGVHLLPLVFRDPLPDGKRRLPLPHISRPAVILSPLSPPPSSTYTSSPLSSSTRRSFSTTSAANNKKMAAPSQKTAEWESQIKRNPHGDFKKVESSRPPFDASLTFSYTQTPSPSWSFGSGPNHPEETKKHRKIDPYSPDRAPGLNYKLLISAIVPRPIAFLSTRSLDGKIENLAPFSYFSVIGHDPPLFTIGFASSLASAKDSLRLLAERKECVINMISEGFLEAANSTAVNAPLGVSEWEISGLTPVYDCETVPEVARVKEAVFSIEGKLESLREFESRSTPGKVSSVLAVIEGKRFWAREDAVDEVGGLLDPAVLRPISRLGGITYGRTTEGIELPRPDFEKDVGGREGYERILEQRKKGGGEGEGEGEGGN